MRSNFIIVLTCILLFRCNTNSEEVKVYYETGELEKTVETSNGKNEGKMIEYFKNGSIKAISYWKDGQQYGKTKHYHNNGNIESIAYFEGDLLQDTLKIYDSLGNILEISMWLNNKKNGFFKQFYTNGNLYMEGQYKNNTPIGEFKYYDEDGDFLYAEDHSYKPQINLSFNKKSYSIGEVVKLNIEFENPRYDSLSLLIGTMDPQFNLVDTLYSHGFLKRKITYSFIAKSLGENVISGHVKDIKIYDDKFVGRSIPFSTTYNVN